MKTGIPRRKYVSSRRPELTLRERFAAIICVYCTLDALSRDSQICSFFWNFLWYTLHISSFFFMRWSSLENRRKSIHMITIKTLIIIYLSETDWLVKTSLQKYNHWCCRLRVKGHWCCNCLLQCTIPNCHIILRDIYSTYLHGLRSPILISRITENQILVSLRGQMSTKPLRQVCIYINGQPFGSMANE